MDVTYVHSWEKKGEADDEMDYEKRLSEIHELLIKRKEEGRLDFLS
ncbi:MAG: hypothetical protein P4M11_15745 [Candidatus Pacebacteria bacterium]|nr:hypothetical protein [Candidatus Paceibacterota bacterium]